MVTRSQIPRLVYPVRQPVWHWAPAFAAAALLIIVLILWRNDVQLQKQVTALQTAITQNEADSQKTREVVAAFTEPDAVHVTLVAAGSKPQPHGRAVFVPRKGVLVFLASNLNPLPPKKSYQLWMIPAAGGAPIPAGRFKPDQRGNAMVLSRHHLPKNSEPKNFAVTVEAEEGASTPTPPIVLVGAGD
jgi:anti-sigma-K factor RskA